MNDVLKRLGFVKRATIVTCITINVGLIAFQDIAAEDKRNVTPTSPLGRFLLVASEGLYVVEPDGRSSWSYHPAAIGQQVRGIEDDIIYDGFALANGHYLFSTHRYIREIDREKRTVWEYRLVAPAEVKSGVPLPNGGIAVLNSQEQAILELKSGTSTVLRRIPVPAKGTDHTRYMLMRRTPEGNYLVALREEQRLVEVTPAGEILHSFSVPGMPVMAQRLADGSTIGTGKFGMVRLDADWKNTWSFTATDASAHFPLLTAWGVTELSDHRLIVANSDWHLAKKDDNRVQFFTVDSAKNISWTLPTAAYQQWKRSEVEPRTGLTEHRSVVVRPLPSALSAM
jgi:hypothetical protein